MSRLSERIENFKKAFVLFSAMQNAYVAEINDMTKLALIQSFEICFELSWKVLKDYLAQKGINAYTPKDVIKEAFSAEIIQNGQIWIDMTDDRNASTHEYNIEKVDEILNRVSTTYFEELTQFNKWSEGIDE